jgi:NAD(P)-dependent dehydrogenase (short-subunit alcohol dehydrogenase family)
MGMMDGKLCMVTGATAGIGYCTALEVARMGASVILIGRDQMKCSNVVKSIQEQTGNQSVEYLLVDLSSQAQIRAAADKFYEQHDHLDILVNNAGGFFLRRRLSVDGIEMTLAVNHLAYFLLTNLLIGALKSSPAARVVNVSSGSHYNEHLDFNNLQLAKFYNPMQAYGRSKLANILFAYELSRRMERTNIASNALTPGMVATDIWKKVNRWLTPLISPVIRRIAQTPMEGAQTSIYLATSPEVEGITGKYFADKKPVRSNSASYDLDASKRLWEISLELVGTNKNLN